ASVGRNYQINAGSVTASDGFGGVDFSSVEHIRLEGSGHDDIINVESLDHLADLDLYGHDGSDIFYIAGQSHRVEPVEGTVVIHRGDGYGMDHEPGMPMPENDDQVYVFDDLNGFNGDFLSDLYGDALHGWLQKFGWSDVDPDLNVIYDQIERTYLHT